MREPQLIACDMKQLEAIDGQEELFLQPQLILALYSSQIHLKQGETISFSEVFAFHDDSICLVVDTNIDASSCPLLPDASVSRQPSAVSATELSASESFASMCEGDSENEVPDWLRQLSGCDFMRDDRSSDQHQEMEMKLMTMSGGAAVTIGDSSEYVDDHANTGQAVRWQGLVCCRIL